MTTTNSKQKLAEAQATARQTRREFYECAQAVLSGIAETIPEAAQRRLKTIVVEERFEVTCVLGREKVAALRNEVDQVARQLADHVRNGSHSIEWPCLPYPGGAADRGLLMRSTKEALSAHIGLELHQFQSILSQYGFTAGSFDWGNKLISPDDLWETAALEPLVPALESLRRAREAEEQARITHDRQVAEDLWDD
ncbi:MAG TPA: hypothetical protein K8V54_05165 [Corynebacterium kroppenstedtii]|nr:hypothetical protein [Corynebacterium kroppenstedtii]